MKMWAIGLGMAAGAALSVTAVLSMYPDVGRRMMRDGRRVAMGACRRIRVR